MQDYLKPEYQKVNEFIALVQPNVLYLKDISVWAKRLYDGEYNLTEKEQEFVNVAGKELFAKAIESYDSDYKTFIANLKESANVSGKKLFMPVRIALSGCQNGPQLEDIYNFLGESEVKARFAKAIEMIGDPMKIYNTVTKQKEELSPSKMERLDYILVE